MTRTKSSLKERYAKQNKYIEEHYDRTTITFPGGTKERIKALGTSVNSFVVNLVLEKLNELENGSPKAEKPIEEPKPVEKHDDETTAAVEEAHTKSPYEEMISRKDDKPEKVDPEVRRRQILEELGMGADAMAPEPSTETDIQRERELEEMRKYVSEGRGFR